jgi:hypothetical protein
METLTVSDRRLARERTEASYDASDCRYLARTPGRARARRQAKRSWSRANRRHGRALTRAAMA